MKTKAPVKIHRFEDGATCKFKAATALGKVIESPRWVERVLKLIDLDYEISIAAAQHAIALARQNGRVDTQAYWLAARVIRDFLQRLDEAGFYLHKQNATLARDLGISESSTRRIRSFQRRFPHIAEVDPKIPWAQYIGNRIPPAAD